ncbi:hypothetical protein [Almyronema epifaneia]|uniref:Lipoprotein n=1 Tax=Almyronema epifaneia S1 TaxID=2991925 RepID=A0ABW6IKT8_9CYAN
MPRIWRFVVLVGCILSLSACSFWQEGPTKAVVQQAIALQAQQIQQDLLQQLSPKSTELPKLSISDVKIERRRLVSLPSAAYQVNGTYSAKIEFSNRTLTERENLFEVYLQRQPESETWLLVRPSQPD